MKLSAIITVLVAIVLSTAACAQESPAPYTEGVHYQVIQDAPAAPTDRVNVVEVFSYGCPHCNAFQPYVNAWHEDMPDYVNFDRMPVAWRNWVVLAKAYYAAEVLGILDESHQGFFRALHVERKPIRSEADIARFFAQYGVEEKAFADAMQSFAVDLKMRQANANVQKFGITATPSLVVNGKYRISATQTVNQPQMIEIAKYLVEKESAFLEAPKSVEAESTEAVSSP